MESMSSCSDYFPLLYIYIFIYIYIHTHTHTHTHTYKLFETQIILSLNLLWKQTNKQRFPIYQIYKNTAYLAFSSQFHNICLYLRLFQNLSDILAFLYFGISSTDLPSLHHQCFSLCIMSRNSCCQKFSQQSSIKSEILTPTNNLSR